LIIFLSKIF